MKILHHSLSFLVGSHFWVGLSAGSFALLSFQFSLSPLAKLYGVWLLLATIAAYGYMRWVQNIRHQNVPGLAHRWFSSHRSTAMGVTVGAALASSYLFIHLFPPNLRWTFAPPALIALLYPLSFPKATWGFSSLRSIPGLKLLLISASWVYLTYALPQILQYQQWDSQLWGGSIARLFFFAGLTIPFDLRDRHQDAPELRTLPQMLGPRAATVWAILGLGIFQFWIAAEFIFFDLDLWETIAWIMGLQWGCWLIRRQREMAAPSPFLISFWIEAVPLFIVLLVLIARQLGTFPTFGLY